VAGLVASLEEQACEASVKVVYSSGGVEVSVDIAVTA
jgi:hypothetical protein